MSIIDEIVTERRRQIEIEGFNSSHDDDHYDGALCQAAGCYALHTSLQLGGEARESVPACWPWEAEWWKPKDPRRNLIRAAALIVAEIERLDREAQTTAIVQKLRRRSAKNPPVAPIRLRK